jgi:TonB family protein
MGNKRILVVDYDPKSLSHTRELLQTAGFDVNTCADGLSALDNFRTTNPDLVLLSPMIPKMHGFEVCSNIRKMPGGDKTPIVIITDVYKGKRYRLDAIKKYGATEYIEKPIEDANLLAILQNLIQGNGTPVKITPLPGSVAEEEDQSTVQFSAEDIKLAIDSAERAITDKQPTAGPNPIQTLPTPGPSPIKKPEKQRLKNDDDINKKLEESLAGLSLDLSKLKSKSKPAGAVKPAPQPVKPSPVPVQPPKPQAPARAISTAPTPSAADGSFTSEDLFTDVIASVERELEHEKIITSSGVKQKAVPTTNPIPVIEPAKPLEALPKKSSFDEELERKISDTLSGILKDKAKAEPAVAKPAEPTAAKVEEPAQPTIQLLRNEIEGAIAAVTSSEGINFGQYLLLSKIAAGGMAELFKAKRKGVEGFEKILAIKRILPHMSDNEEFITMFIDEAKLAAQLTHHNICQIFDLGKIDNSYYIAMEYVHGKDLRAVLKAARTKSKTIPAELGILITSKLCSALDYAHRKNDSTGQPLNLVHRDVSPQNILITYEGDVKLVDFGIAKAATKVHVTQHGALKGKLLYMSPEQAWGKTVDKRSDIFSVCAVLYEMLAGRPLFFGDDDTEVTILEKVRDARVTPICSVVPTLPKELEKILNKGLQKNPEDRYQLASELQKDLDNLFYTEGYNATSASLASFTRDLFPEDWVQESGGRETLVIGKEITDQFKSKQPEKVVEKPAAPVANAQSAVVTIPPTKIQPTPPQPAVDSSPSKEIPKQASKVAEVPKAAPVPEPTPIVSPKIMERELESEPSPNVTSPTHQISSTGFRDISAPEIIPPQQTGSNFIKFLVAGIVLAAIVGGVVYFMFRPPARTNTQQNTPQQTEKSQVSSTSTEPKTPQASTQNPVTAANPSPETEQQKAALLKLIEEQKKKEEALKEEQKKKDELAKLDQQKKLEEQKKLDEAKKKEDEARAEELKKAEAEKALEEQRQKEAAAAEEQARVAQLEQQPPPAAATEQPPAEPATETPQQPAVNEGDLVELAPDVSKPVLVKKIEADYPPVALQKKVEGTVILGLLVDENGQVSDVQILRPAGGSSGLNESAVSAVRKWTFRPAVKAGKRVKVRVTYPVVFKLK